MFVAGTLEDDQELIENIATVMQGARVAACGASEDADASQVQLSLELTGRPDPQPEEPE